MRFTKGNHPFHSVSEGMGVIAGFLSDCGTWGLRPVLRTRPSDEWVLTHCASGKAIGIFPSRKAAKGVAVRFSGMAVDWKARKPKADKAVCLAIMEQLGGRKW